MKISPDTLVFWEYGFFHFNATILFTWILMLILVVSAKLITRKLVINAELSRWQCTLEIIVITIRDQLIEIGINKPEKYIGFIGTLFIFIFVSNLMTFVPRFEPPTASLSTTAALAICVFISVPVYGIKERGIKNYLKSYLKPNFVMLPFHIISEISRTLSLAIRLFGNMMSGSMAVGILLSIAPFFFPMIMTSLGLLIGTVQAYIFSTLASVYIASATSSSEE